MNKILALLLLLLSNTVFCQVIEKVVAVAPISYDKKNTKSSDADRLYNYIINDLHQTKRLKVIDRLNQGNIVAELDAQKRTESVLSDNLVKQGKLLGANFIMLCEINNAKAEEQFNRSGESTGFECELSLFLKIVDVETGELRATALVTPKGIQDRSKSKGPMSFLGSYGKGDTAPEAVRASMEKVEPHIHSFIDKNFPLEMHINDIQEVVHSTSKKDKAVTEVFIKGGISTGLKLKDNLIIKEIVQREIGDDVFIDEVIVGKMKVIRVSNDLVVCKLISQTKVVKEVFEQNENRLKVVFTPRTAVF